MGEHDNDPVEDETPIFTQAEVFQIGGYLADIWDGPDNEVDDIEKAIRSVLNRPKGD